MSTLQTESLAHDTAITVKTVTLYESVLHHLREYVPTLATEFTVLVSQILVYKLAAHYWGKQGFSEYAVARRTLSLIFPLPLLGLSIGLQRYMGYSNGSGEAGSAGARYLAATLWCAAFSTMLCMLAMNIFPQTFSFLFFGNRGYSSFVFPLSLMLLGLCLHTIVCGYFRGRLEANRANLIQFLNMGLLPSLVLTLVRHSLSGSLLILGVGWTFIAACGLALTPIGYLTQNTTSEARQLLRYGIQRVPGDFILMALFTLPVTIVAHMESLQQAGFLAFGISMLSMVGAIFSPIGLVLLPKATYMLADGAHQELRKHVRHISRVTAALSTFLIAIVLIFASRIIALYLGHGYEAVAHLIRLLILGALPYSLYLVFRNIVDAFHKDGVTTGILAAGLATSGIVLVIVMRFAEPSQSTAIALSLGLVIISVLSGWECNRVLRTTPVSRSINS